MRVNKHGLSRTIDSDIKRQIRKECGFGCVICGSAIYQYEHIIPEFKDAKNHDVDKMALLCGSCHLNVTKGLWSKEKIFEHRKNPFSIINKESAFSMDITNKNKINITLGNCSFINTNNIVEIDNKVILKILPPECKGAPPRITANFFDQNETEVASIYNNEWIGNLEAFDIESVGSEFTIRSAKYKIDLKIEIKHPNIINILKINLNYNNKSLSGDIFNGFTLKSNSTEISFGKAKRIFKDVNYGMLIKGNDIYLSENRLFDFKRKNDEIKKETTGYIKAVGDIRVIVREKGDPKGQFKIEATGSEKNSYLNLEMPLDDTKRYSIHLNNKINAYQKCHCGSTINYKNCCYKNTKIINSFLKNKSISQYITYLAGTYKLENAIFDIRFVKGQIPTKLFVNHKKELNLKFNSANLPNFNRVAFSLALFDCIKGNYHYFLDPLYQDNRQNLIRNLDEFLIRIPLNDKLKRRGFDTANEFEVEYSAIIQNCIKPLTISENYKSIKNFILAIHLLGISYDCDFSSKEQENYVFNFYENNYPVAYDIFFNVIQIILNHNIYQFKEFNKCKLKILEYINVQFNEDFSKAKEQVEMHYNKTKDIDDDIADIEFNKPKID